LETIKKADQRTVGKVKSFKEWSCSILRRASVFKVATWWLCSTRCRWMHRSWPPTDSAHVRCNGGAACSTGPAMHNEQNRRGRAGRDGQPTFKAEVQLALGMKPSVSTSLAAGNCQQNATNISLKHGAKLIRITHAYPFVSRGGGFHA
jgi:hypothetical protein